MSEVWKVVPSYHEYQASSFGRIRYKDTIINGHYRSGYKQIYIRKFQKNRYIHILVCEAFHGKSNLQVNHINGIKDDNRPENLEWTTQKENVIHAYRIGLSDHKGSKNGRAKLNEEQVLEIKELLSLNPSRYKDYKKIAAKYRVSPYTIRAIQSNNNWKHTIERKK
jgi:hypothetical protein